MKILDRYIFGETLKAFLAALFICALLLLVGRVFDKLGDLLDARGRVSLASAALYFLLSLPFELAQVLPLVATLAVLASVGRMARQREVVAMLSGGVSVRRLAAPVAAFGVLVAAGGWALGEYVVPGAESQARVLEAQLLGKKPRDRNKEIVAADMDGRSLYAQSYALRRARGETSREEMSQACVWQVDPETWRLRWRLDTEQGRYLGDAPDGKTRWEFDGSIEHVFRGDGELESRRISPDFIERELGNNLNLYLRVEKEPEEMNFEELSRYIGILQSRGDDASAYRTDLHLKIAFPLGVALLGLVVFACALGASGGGSLMAAAGAGIVAAFAYFFMSATSQAVGRAGFGLPPEAWAWLTNALFALAAVAMISRAGRAR